MTALPPGPGMLSAFTMLFDLSTTIGDYAKKYGDPFTLPSVMGAMVTTVSPEGNKAILGADPDLFVPSGGDAFRFALGNSVLLQHGAEHRRSRKLLMPPFHGARMRTYGDLMRKTALRYLQQWEPGRPFVLIDTTQAITLDVILEAVFGVDSAARLQQFRGQVLDLLGAFSPLLFIKPLRRELFGLGPWARFQRRNEALRTQVFALIAEHRATLEGRTDILSLLISARDEAGNGLSDQDIMDQLVTLVFAGHETTAVTLAWAVYCLLRSPEALERLRAELAPLGDQSDPEAVARAPYLEAVCNEALRLYPPVHLIHRRLVRPMTLCGYELPAGTVVGAGAHATHRLESLYPEPERFRPERFLERTFTPFEFLPWGGGARRCLGAAFAMYEMKIVLAALVRGYRLRLLEKGEVKLALRPGTVGPKGGIRVQLEERLAPETP